MKIVIAGASGFLGSALVPALRTSGHDVFRLVRGRDARAPDEIAWDPVVGEIDRARLEGADAIVNLAGENVGEGRWTVERRERILRSRVDATRTLIVAVGKMTRKPNVFVNASAIGFYGDRGDEIVTERTEIGHGFLAEVCLAWETHAEGAARLGVRTALLRFGLILAAQGGTLAKMLPLFRLGLGGRFGSGQQWMSWIGIDDTVGAVRHVLGDARCSGPINVVAPTPVTNAEFSRALARELHRPAMLPVPVWALRVAVGRMMADEALLASARAVPNRLIETGYSFRHPVIADALHAVLGR